MTSPALDPRTRELLQSFRLRPRQKATVWDAYLASPEGLLRCARRAHNVGQRSGSSGAGLLLTMIGEGEHLFAPQRKTRRLTGWRFLRGTHSGTYVPDPLGTDPLPEGYGSA